MRGRVPTVRTGSVSLVLLLCGMGCAGAPLLRLPSIGARAPRSSSPEVAVGRVDLGGLPQDEQRVDPQRQKRGMLLARARLHETDRQLDQAARVYQEILQQDPRHPAALHRLAVVSAELGDPEAADKYFQQALRVAPEQPELLNDYGYFCYLTARWDDAERHLVQALALNPTFPPAHVNLGLLVARRGESETALAHFRRAGCTEEEARHNLDHSASSAIADAQAPAQPSRASRSPAGFATIAN